MFASFSRACMSLNPHHLFSCCVSLLPDLFPGAILILYLNNYFLKIFEVFHFIMLVSVSVFNSRPLKLFSNLCPAITVTRFFWALSFFISFSLASPNFIKLLLLLKILQLYCEACGILVPRPGVEPTPHAVQGQSFNHWTPREILWACLNDHISSQTQWFCLRGGIIELHTVVCRDW